MQHERNKKAILASGIDPNLKRFKYLQAVKSAHKKKYVKALNDIEDFWDKVFTTLEEKGQTPPQEKAG